MNNYTTFIDKSQHYKFIIFLDMSEETRVLEIHTLNYNLFLKEKLIAIGWNKIGDLSKLSLRILVQVKSQDSDIKETTIQSLKGAMHEGDYGLFVTLSNYTKKAQKYLDNTPIIRGINGKELVDLILKYYDSLSEKYRKMISLKMVYIPVINND